MGKKSKKARKKEKKILRMWDLDSKSIKILESGKIKFKKDEKIDISAFVDASVNDAKISRLEGIPSKEEIIIDDTSNYRVDVSANCSSITRIIDLVSSINTMETQTIVLPMTKKKASELEDNELIGWLAKCSSFVSVYSKLKEAWNDLNEDDKTSYTNVMFIPKLYVFLEKKGKLRKIPITVNLMVVAFPSINRAKEGIEVMDDIEYVNRIIGDTIDASIRCGCKSIIVEPYGMNALKKDVHYTAKYWYGKTETQRVIENIRNITFSIDNDDLYVIFCKNKKQTM